MSLESASSRASITSKIDVNVLGDLTYDYDKAGNRTKIGGSFARTGIPHSVGNTAYNAANHQTTFGDKTLTYDNNGNLTSISDANGTTDYTWNAKNQLIGLSGPSVNASFVYDGLGRREKKTINGNLTEFLYDGVNPVQETSGATVLANTLTGLGIDEFFARTDVPAGITSNFLSDALGSTIGLADSTGTVQTENTYEPFGKTRVTGDADTNPFQYTGREDDGTGLYYYRARYYHPGLQRFMSEDPIEFRGGELNLYAYVLNNPIAFSDPTGESLAAHCKRILGKWKKILIICWAIGAGEKILEHPKKIPTPPAKGAPPKGPPAVVPPIPAPDDELPSDEPPPDCGRKCPPAAAPPPPPPPPDDDCPWDGTQCGPAAS